MPEKKRNPHPVLWGGYKPDIYSSYPNPPVRGNIVNTQNGREFRPDPQSRSGQAGNRRHVNYNLSNWIVNANHDLVIQAMREEADKAIRELRAGIDRLDRFIENN